MYITWNIATITQIASGVAGTVATVNVVKGWFTPTRKEKAAIEAYTSKTIPGPSQASSKRWAMVGFAGAAVLDICFLIHDLRASGPVTRGGVFAIAVDVALLAFYALAAWLVSLAAYVQGVISLLGDVTDVIKETVLIQGKLVRTAVLEPEKPEV